MDNQVTTGIMAAMNKAHEMCQNMPNQYIVAYKRKSDDSLIGYHISTFCQISQDPLDGKRYSGDKPDAQLSVIWKNFTYMMSKREEPKKDIGGLVDSLSNIVKKGDWDGINPDDVYIDAVYLAEGMPKQEFSAILVDPKNTDNGPVSDTE